MNIIQILLCLALLWFIIILILVVYSYKSIFYPNFQSSEYSLNYALTNGECEQEFLNQAWETSTISSPNSEALSLYSLAGKGRGTAVFVHGITSTHFGMLKYMKSFAEQGWNIVAFDLPGHGASPAYKGRAPGFGFQEKTDLEVVVTWAHEHFSGSRPFIIVGESMGAATALQYSALPTAPDAVDAIIADCSYSDMEEELEVRLKSFHIPRIFLFPVLHLAGTLSKRFRGFSLKEASPQKAVLASTLPILFIHGADDTYVPSRMSEKMAEQRKLQGKAPTSLCIIPGARHAASVLVNPEAWFSIVFRFIDEYVTKM